MDGEFFDVPEQIRAWVNLSDIVGEPSDLSREVLEGLKSCIEKGQIQVEGESDKYYRLIGSKFPIGLNRIDWRGVGEHLTFDVLPVLNEGIPREVERIKLTDCRHVIRGWFDSAGICLQEEIIWTGDETKVSLHMNIETLLEVYPRLFNCPQHHYVLPLTGEWCLNYAMEGQLYFGKAENAIAQGPVDFDSV
jgi:hypothetical protein